MTPNFEKNASKYKEMKGYKYL